MAEAFQIEANRILGRPSKVTFWTDDAAKAIVDVHHELGADGIEHERACGLIRKIWNAASDESGD